VTRWAGSTVILVCIDDDDDDDDYYYYFFNPGQVPGVQKISKLN